MLGNIREWVSDNLRYLLLGLAVLLGAVIIFFVVRLIVNWGDKEVVDERTGKVTEQSAGKENNKENEKKDDSEKESDTDDITLTANDPAILDVMTRYYEAKAGKDFETIREINPAFSAEDEADLANNSVFERYDNIMVYSSEGLDSDSYIVYVYFDVKITGIATPAPTLVDEYLQKNDEGDLIIVNKNSTQELADFIEKMRTSSAVQKMVEDVNQKLEQASASDEDLNKYVEKLKEGKSSDSDSDDGGEDDSTADAPKVNGTARATTEVRVRSEASTNGVIYGMLTTGFSVKVLENLDSGWSKIQYTANGVTIEGYVMTQYLEAE